MPFAIIVKLSFLKYIRLWRNFSYLSFMLFKREKRQQRANAEPNGTKIYIKFNLFFLKTKVIQNNDILFSHDDFN